MRLLEEDLLFELIDLVHHLRRDREVSMFRWIAIMNAECMRLALWKKHEDQMSFWQSGIYIKRFRRMKGEHRGDMQNYRGISIRID